MKYQDIINKITDKTLQQVKGILKVEYKETAALKDSIGASLQDFTYPVYVYILTHDYDNRIEIDNNRCKKYKNGILVNQYIHIHYKGGKKHNSYDLCLLDAMIEYLEDKKNT